MQRFRLQRYKKVCKLRAMGALKVTEGGCFFVTFVFFLMGIVPNNHQNSYNNETIIIDCVGPGSAGADWRLCLALTALYLSNRGASLTSSFSIYSSLMRVMAVLI